MFANSNIQPLPVIVVNDMGKRKRAKLVKLVVCEAESTCAVIKEVVVELHKKVKE